MPPGTGMMQNLGTDAIYSFVIIFISLMIYLSTKELYELSSHKGIKYFRLAFLFFAIAFTFRFLTQSLVIYFGMPRLWNTNLFTLSALFSILFIYASTAAVFYLWASNKTNWLSKKSQVIALHIIAILITLTAPLTKSVNIILLIQFALIIFLAITAHLRKAKKKSSLELHVIYTLIAIFWALNLIDILIPRLLFQTQILIYLASISLFLILLQRVIRKT